MRESLSAKRGSSASSRRRQRELAACLKALRVGDTLLTWNLCDLKEIFAAFKA